MQEKLMRKGEWVKPPMTVTEWMTAVNTGHRREFLNAKRCATDHAVWSGIKDPHGSMASTIKSCLSELSGCKVHDVYPDLQNKEKLKHDMIVPLTRHDKYTKEVWIDNLTVDIKTPALKDSKWVCVAEKYEKYKCDVYLFIYAETPPLSFDTEKGMMTIGTRPNGEAIKFPRLLVPETVKKFKDHVHGCLCLGWARGDYIFRPEHKRQKPGSELGFFILREELKDTLEDCYK